MPKPVTVEEHVEQLTKEKLYGRPLENQADEAFCQKVASGMPTSQAYLEAGFQNTTNSSRYLKRASIQRRLLELRSEQLNKKLRQTTYSREWVIEQLIDIAIRTKETGQWKDAIHAIQLLGQDLGMFIRRTETRRGDAVSEADAKAIKAEIRNLVAKLGFNIERKDTSGDAEEAGEEPAEPVRTVQ